MLNTTIVLGKEYRGIYFGKEENNTEIIFHGKFYESSGTPKVFCGAGVRYGIKDNKYYIVVESYSMLSKTASYVMTRYKEEKIECTVIKNGNKTHGYVCMASEPDQEWNLGIVVICLDHKI